MGMGLHRAKNALKNTSKGVFTFGMLSLAPGVIIGQKARNGFEKSVTDIGAAVGDAVIHDMSSTHTFLGKVDNLAAEQSIHRDLGRPHIGGMMGFDSFHRPRHDEMDGPDF